MTASIAQDASACDEEILDCGGHEVRPILEDAAGEHSHDYWEWEPGHDALSDSERP